MPPGVELDARRGKGDSAVGWIEGDFLPSGDGAESAEFSVGGNAAFVAEEAPGLHEAADGDVECAIADAAPMLGGLEESEHFGVGGDGFCCGVLVDA